VEISNIMVMISKANPKPNLMVIIIYVASMVTRNLIATRKRKNKVVKDLKNQTTLMARRRIRNFLIFMLINLSLTLS